MADEMESRERKTSVASDSPDHVNERESPEEQNQSVMANAESAPKDWKVWTEEETRTLIQLYKNYISNYPENYPKKVLFEELAKDLQKRGYAKEPERIRNRMKSLRTAYRRTIEYNATHILKKQFPYLEDLADLYNMTPGLDDDTSSHSGYSMSVNRDDDDYSIASSNDSVKKPRIVKKNQTLKVKIEPASKTKVGTLATTFKYTSLRKKIPSKKNIFPLFQCGQCLGKFSTSQELHSHDCQCPTDGPKVNGTTKRNSVQKKKSTAPPQNTKAPFQWTGMATLQFLTLLKGYQMKNGNSQDNLLNVLSTAMKKRRLQVSPIELKKKWRCLASNYEKTVSYNRRHQDQKKCAFYNRLTELYGLGGSLDMFEGLEPEKMTVEVSTSEPQQSNYSDVDTRNGYFPNENNRFIKGEIPNGNSELVMWLDSFWKEWKEIDQKREQANAERHIELMEILACLAENTAK